MRNALMVASRVYAVINRCLFKLIPGFPTISFFCTVFTCQCDLNIQSLVCFIFVNILIGTETYETPIVQFCYCDKVLYASAIITTKLQRKSWASL